MKQNKLAGKRSVATSLAAERLEAMATMRFRDAAEYAEYAVAGEVAAAGPPAVLAAGYGTIDAYPEFRRVVTLTHDQPRAGMLRVMVDVYWMDSQQGEKNHRIVTFLHPILHSGR